jgi:sigma-E factor negative regulatory protein RseA
MMVDPLNQKISQYLDGDLDPAEVLQLLQAMQQQPHLNQTMQRYALINQAVKSRPVIMADAAFTVQLQEKLAQEPVYFLPQHRRKIYFYPKAALALAASLMAVAVIVPIVKNLNARQSPAVFSGAQYPQMPTKDTLMSANTLQSGLLANSPAKRQTTRLYPVNKRFQDYLQAHNGSLYMNDPANFQYRAQVASYGRGE